MTNKNKGISLVELVTAMSILSVSTLMIISCFYGITSIKTKSMIYEDMELISRNIYEELRATGDWSENEFDLDDDGTSYVYREVFFQIEIEDEGLCTIVFTSDYYDNEKAFYFWVNPDLINANESEESNEDAQ